VLVRDFKELVMADPDLLLGGFGKHEDRIGYFVENSRFETLTHFSVEAIRNNDKYFLVNQTIQGKNVDHITRITGYFTRTSSWNKGKLGEFMDRYRSDIN